MAVGLHRGLCPGRGLCRDHGPDRGLRPGRPRLDLQEVLEVLRARPLEWWSTRQPAATARTNLQLAISSFRFSLWRHFGKLSPPQATAHDEDRTGSEQPGAVPIRTVSKPVETRAPDSPAAAWQERASVMSVDTPRHRFHNRKEAGIPLTPRKTSLEQALEEAVSRALRDNLAPLQRTADELHHAYADLVAACSSSSPSNALPALLRAQTNAAALAAGLSVLSNFVAVALNPSREQQSSEEREFAGASSAADVAEPKQTSEEVAEEETARESAREAAPAPSVPVAVQPPPEAELEWVEEPEEVLNAAPEVASVPPDAPPPEAEVAEEAFELANLPREEQELHRRANRVAKVAMQDIKLLQPKEVRLGREHKDICVRLRVDIDKARKEYDRRFRAIQDHPVDYFYDWMVEILADGDAQALGEYPYPSPVLRH
jgi:hypothetical protein